MNSANNTSAGLMDTTTYRKYMLQYERENPHDLPELRRKRRPRIATKASMPEMVFSTRNIA